MAVFEKTFGGMPSDLEESRRYLSFVLGEIGWSAREIDLQLAIGEVMQNVVRYGFNGGSADGTITMRFEFDGTSLICEVKDNAPPSNPDEWMLKAEERRPDEGGYGLSIIEAIAKKYEVFPGSHADGVSGGEGNISKMTFVDQQAEG